MSARLNELYRDFSPWLSLQVTPKERNRIWEQTQDYSNTHARYNAYLNKVCLNTFLTWLSAWCVESSLPQPSIGSIDDTLEVVNGTAIQLGDLARIVLIPSEPFDSEDLCVPQEWVDIPSWAGDYYLAVQVDLAAEEDECCIQVSGFATHRQLKSSGKYTKESRTYVLAGEKLIEDLILMQAMLGLNMKEKLPPLPTLSEAQATKLLQYLGDKSVYFPRLQVDVPFEQWAALLSDNKWRQQLYKRRMGRFVEETKPAVAINLSKWFGHIFEAGWQSLEALLNSESGNFDFRLGHRDLAVREVTAVPVRGIKLIDLGIQLGNKSVALLVGLTPETEQRVSIRVQLHPAKGETYLPPNIKLALLSQLGETLQEVCSRSQDEFMQLPKFGCPRGKVFQIKISADEFSITENFVIESIIEEKHE